MKTNISNQKETKVYQASVARNKFADVFDEACYGTTVVIEKRNRKVAVVSMSVLERLSSLEALVDSMHAEEALREFNQLGGKTMRELKKELSDE